MSGACPGGEERGLPPKAVIGPGAQSSTCPGLLTHLGSTPGALSTEAGQQVCGLQASPSWPRPVHSPDSLRPPGITAPWAGCGCHGNWHPERHAAW